MAPLNLYAGQTAYNYLANSTFSPNLFTQFLGASGGPKWFVLAGLDKALFGEFFNQHCGPLNILGSSSGAFRAACFAQAKPEQAINRLATGYARMVYSSNPSAYEVTEKARELIHEVVPPQGIIEIMNNDRFTVHFITARCKGSMKSGYRFRQLIGLLASATLNRFNREYLKFYFERTIFSSRKDQIIIHDPHNIPTKYIKMGFNSVHDALLASGAIPLVLEGIRDIVDAPHGLYRDGGIIDYHFDIGLEPTQRLTLYPHFYEQPIPGWFDKRHPNRLPHATSYDNVLMMVPSQSFIESLPYGKIPDRTDFKKMDDKQRIKYWQTVIQESHRVGDYFLELLEQDRIAEVIKPLPFACRS